MTTEVPYKDFSREVFERSAARSTPLVKAHFEITYRCNLHCVHCYTDPFNAPAALREELSYAEILKILDDLFAHGVLWLTLSGGEAMVHPRFKDIYRAAKARGFIVSLLSNASVVTDAVADFLADDPPFQLEVSVHGATASVYDRVTQVPQAHALFRQGLRRLLDRKLPVRLKTNALTLNQKDLGALRAFVEDLGLEFNLYTVIYPRLNGDLSSTTYRLTPDEIVALEQPARQASHGSRPVDARLYRCGCGTSSVTINPYGWLRPCTFTTEPRYNLRELSVREAFDQLAAAIDAARYTGESACRQCPVHVYCEKNPAMALVEAGSVEAPVPHFCELAYKRHDLSI